MGFTATAPVPAGKSSRRFSSNHPRTTSLGWLGEKVLEPELWSLLPPWKGQGKPLLLHWQRQSLSNMGNRCAEGAFDFLHPPGDVITDSRKERNCSEEDSVISNQGKCPGKSRKIYSNEDYCAWAQPFVTTLLHLVETPDILTWTQPILLLNSMHTYNKVDLYWIFNIILQFNYIYTVKLCVYKIHKYSPI